MVNYYRLIGAAFIAFGAIGIICAVVLHIGITLNWIWYEDFRFINVPAILQIVLIVFIVLIPIPSIVAGFAITKEKEWAKKVILVLCIFYLLFFPIGTIISILTMLIISRESQENNSSINGSEAASTS